MYILLDINIKLLDGHLVNILKSRSDDQPTVGVLIVVINFVKKKVRNENTGR
jgi:hypothetical protein